MCKDAKAFKKIALCVSRHMENEQQKYIKNICNRAKVYNCKVVVFSTASDLYYGTIYDDGEASIFRMIDVLYYDAIVLLAESFKRDAEQYELIARAKKAGVPVIVINREIEGCYCLSFDFNTSFRNVVEHMVGGHGYRRINFLAGMPDNDFSDNRINIYKEVLAKYGIPFEDRRVGYGYFWDEPTRKVLDEWLDSDMELPEAIISSNDSMALTTISVLTERGYRVPEDVAVSGFDGIDTINYTDPLLTTSGYDYKRMFDTIFDMVVTNFEGYSKHIILENRMMIGHSCGCDYNRVLDATRKMMDLEWQMGYDNDYNQRLNNMISTVSFGDYHDAFRDMKSFLDRIGYKNFYCCINAQTWDKMAKSIGIEGEGESEDYYSRTNKIHYINYRPDSEYSGDVCIPHSEMKDILAKLHEEHDYYMVTPLHIDGKPIGYNMICFDCNNFQYSSYNSFCYNVRYIIMLMMNKNEMQRLYLTDSLTGLYNRNGFYSNVAKLIETIGRDKLAVISVDMDNLKTINDTYGHSEGDIALKALGRILYKAVEEDYICSRVGGDEFLVVFKDSNPKDKVRSVINKITWGLARYNEGHDGPYDLCASIGAYWDYFEGKTLDYFLQKADKSMYEEKRRHKAQRKS